MPFALVSLISFLIVLSIMVVVHEFGHFIVAKLCGVRVETFSLGFPPRLFGIKYGDTDYCVSALPFGGYVKMAGEQPGTTTGDPHDFGARPRWQRVLIAVAGPISNFILAFVLMTGFFMMHNEVPVYMEHAAVLDVVPTNSAAARAGLLAGDRIVRFDGKKNPTWDDVATQADLDVNSTVPITVARTVDGQTKEFSTELYLASPGKNDDFDLSTLGLVPQEQNTPVKVADVVSGDPAEKAGLRPGDEVVAVDGQTVHGVPAIIALANQGNGKPVSLLVERNGQPLYFTVTPAWSDFSGEQPAGYRLGFSADPPPYRVEDLALPAAVRHSVSYNVKNSGYILDVLYRLVSHHAGAMQQISGPVGIARMTGEAAEMHGWEPLVGLTALISLDLGIMNLLPIPILDGGMILLLLIESLMRRDLKQELKERVYQVAFIMIILFFAFITVNDVSKLSFFSHLKP